MTMDVVVAGASVTVELPRCREPGVPQKTNTQEILLLNDVCGGGRRGEEGAGGKQIGRREGAVHDLGEGISVD